MNGSVTGSLRAFWHPVSSCMPRVSWGHRKTPPDFLRFPNIVSNTISMSSGPTKTHGYDLPSDDGSCIDDTDPRKPPPHWTFEGGKYPSFVPLHWVLWALFQFLCLVSFGQKNLRHVWAACYRGCSKEVWEKKRGAMRERVQHINIVVRLR